MDLFDTGSIGDQHPIARILVKNSWVWMVHDEHTAAGGAEMEGFEKFQLVGSKAWACKATAATQKPMFSISFFNIFCYLKSFAM